LAQPEEKPIPSIQVVFSGMENQKSLGDEPAWACLGEETQDGPKKQEPCRFYIVPAMDFPTMMMELLPSKLVSIDGGLPHGEWSREAEKITIKWNYESNPEKAKMRTYDYVVNGIMKSRVQDVHYCHFLIPVENTVGS